MTRRRLTADVCEYVPLDPDGAPTDPCPGAASFRVVSEDTAHRVCLRHVGHASEVLNDRPGIHIAIQPDYQRDGRWRS